MAPRIVARANVIRFFKSILRGVSNVWPIAAIHKLSTPPDVNGIRSTNSNFPKQDSAIQSNVLAVPTPLHSVERARFPAHTSAQSPFL